MKKEERFTYEDDRHVERTIEVKPSDFEFVQENAYITDEKFKRKPTTFLKDAFRRFAKNKSSVVGGIIIGILMILAFVLPATIPYSLDINILTSYQTDLQPKLFNAGTGWWDGTKTVKHKVYDMENEKPASEDYLKSGVRSITVSKKGDYYTDSISPYAYGGYIRFWSPVDKNATSSSFGEFYSYTHNYDFNTADYKLSVTIGDLPSDSFTTQGEYAIALRYYDVDPVTFKSVDTPTYDIIKPYSSETGTFDFDINDAVKDSTSVLISTFHKATKASIVFLLKASSSTQPSILIKQSVVTSDNSDETEDLKGLSCYDANASLSIAKTNTDGTINKYYWTVLNAQTNLYHADIYYCDFVYDGYEADFGLRDDFLIGNSLAQQYVDKGYMTLDIDTYLSISNPTQADLDNLISSFRILNDQCPLRSVTSVDETRVPGVAVYDIVGTVSMYRYYGYTSMPRFLMGTNESGKDMLKLTFTGLRTSLLLGIIVTAVCFIFGLVWGAISGYFGGWIDIIMQRFTDIIGGIPWIVLMTLIMIKYGSTFQTLAIALCLTGWLGTAGLTRTQFYRFKRREYILASRTLGASDIRLIFRHILPNGIGTIITASVLMIPGVIFSEAILSYLGLVSGLESQGIFSLGVTLSDNQNSIQTYPFQIVFPSVVMALIMISFNLFGNGLRDAFNPSLKGNE